MGEIGKDVILVANDNASARVLELEADNRRLRRMLDQQDTPAELRHRLRSTVAMIRTIVRRSAETKREIDVYVGHLEDRLDALVRAQATADEYGTIDLHALLADELRYYSIEEGDLLELSGPAIELQPRAGQVFALAIHELAVNAVEHGGLGIGKGRLLVSWSVSGPPDGEQLTLNWKELGSPSSVPTTTGFGTEVLTQTLRYEMDATTTQSFDPDGFHFRLSMRLSQRIGRAPK